VQAWLALLGIDGDDPVARRVHVGDAVLCRDGPDDLALALPGDVARVVSEASGGSEGADQRYEGQKVVLAVHDACS
jgi:hypothetical protein